MYPIQGPGKKLIYLKPIATATVAPVGLTAEGMPVGIQIIGPYLEDRTPMHIAKLMENITGGFVPPPGYEDE